MRALLLALLLAAPVVAAEPIVVDQPVPYGGVHAEGNATAGRAWAEARAPLVRALVAVAPGYAGAGGYVAVVAASAAATCQGDAAPPCDPVVATGAASVGANQVNVLVYDHEPGYPTVCADAPGYRACTRV